MSIHRITATVAGLAVLAFGASAIPASARLFDINGNGSVVPAQTAASSSTPVPPILPRIKESQIARIERAEQQAAAYQLPKGAAYSNAEDNIYATAVTRHVTAGVVAATTPRIGFAWGDAGVGAAAGFLLAMLGLGAVLVTSDRRPRRSRQAAATPS